MKARDLMSGDVKTCTPDASLSEATRIMWDGDCGFVPVVEPDLGTLVGVVTDRDACMAVFTQGRPLSEIPVGTAMSTRLHACHEDDDVGVVHEIMRSHQIRRVPVLDRGDRIVGVISLNDLAVRSPGQGGRQAKLDVAETLKAVCSPRPVASA